MSWPVGNPRVFQSYPTTLRILEPRLLDRGPDGLGRAQVRRHERPLALELNRQFVDALLGAFDEVGNRSSELEVSIHSLKRGRSMPPAVE
jgi:hypothetical protein